MSEHIMVIDDDIHIGNMLEEALSRDGYKVSRAYSGTEALMLLSAQKPDLVLLDLMLPGLSGEELLPKIEGIPVIIVSAKIDIDNKVELLLSGAADYITKPFDIKELKARIKVQLRSRQFTSSAAELVYKELKLNTDTHNVTVNGEDIRLTRTEFAILKPGDTLMGMDLNMGGHLTHGSSANISGTYFHVVPYGVDETGYLDYDKLMDLAMENHPKLIIAGASAYARTIDFTKFRKVADACGAVLMADIAHIAGLVATGLHPSPIGVADIVTTTTHKTLRGPRGGMILANEDAAKEFKLNKAVFPGIQGGPLEHVIAGKAVCFKEDLQPEFRTYSEQILKNAQALCSSLMKRGIKIVSDGTDNHLMVIDLTNFDETGKEVEKWLDDAHITVNKETIPNETRSPFVTSGLRLGTPAVTTRGLKEADMDDLAEAISLVIRNREEGIEPARAIVAQITAKYPLDLTEN